VSWDATAEGSAIRARVGAGDIFASIGAPGRHTVQNALAVLGTAHLTGADIDKVAQALATLEAEAGRGRRHVLRHPEGIFTLIDESYNANPASMKAAMELLQATQVSGEGRRIAVLGDMLELGTHSQKLHAGLAEIVEATGIGTVLLAGPEMKALAERLPEGVAREYRPDAAALKPVLLNTVRPGDVVMVKSSKGIGFSKLVEALLSTFPAEAAQAAQA
jgi:UDP-N-acetylmuramoyl-tripeptide--D-alanyl-D-alanine ligase